MGQHELDDIGRKPRVGANGAGEIPGVHGDVEHPHREQFRTGAVADAVTLTAAGETKPTQRRRLRCKKTVCHRLACTRAA
jgi:hypothetical protein